MKRQTWISLALAAAAVTAASGAAAHGIVGKRFFPATLSVDDPFVADELSLPTITSTKDPASGDEPASRNLAISADIAKTITRDFGIEIGRAWIHQKPDGGVSASGWDNLEAGAKYQFYKDEASESVASIGVDWDIGGTGAKRIGAESFSTVTPTLFFGKGMGDLPDSMGFLKPFAITGALGFGIPTRASTTSLADDGSLDEERHPNTIEWGFSLEYSIPYLQSFVKDVGLGAPFSRLTPIVEFAFSTPVNRGGGATTGTVGPGLLWDGQYFQLGFEALIPVNDHSGRSIGGIVQLHLFLDDLFPNSIGKPLFGN